MSWQRLAPLPRIRYDRKSKRWTTRRDRYAELDKQPLLITAQLVTPVIHAERDMTHLDAVLSFAALTNHPVETVYPDKGVCVVPLPLELAWVSPQGLPLWACTPLMPVGDTHESREYWHKRYPGHRAEFGQKLNAVTTAGRWKEYRTPVAAQHVNTLAALCIGNAEEIKTLLAVVSHIGKKGGMGYGRVAKWHVEAADHGLQDILPHRPVPVAYYADRQPIGKLSLNRAFTPPYWYAPWWCDCLVK